MTSSHPMRTAAELASALDLPAAVVRPYGHHMAKIDHRLAAEDLRPGGRTVLVTAINPTPAGEGKTVNTIGLSMALTARGKRAVATLRQPSMGPVFGVKGGGAGGGACQMRPMTDVNLHLTGDFHAVAAANNLLAAALDTSLLLDNPLKIDPERVTWRRVVDMNDRALREVRVGLGGTKNGVPRDGAFDITAASEIMAILALATSISDLRARLGRIQIGESLVDEPVTAEELGAAGAMAVVLRDALDPTLVQTSEGTPVLVHAGPFANIAQGNCSAIADRMAANLGDYVVTEAGFGSDMGAEKYFNIKCRVTGMRPDCAVLVVTARALKFHSGRFKVKPGRPLPTELAEENLDALAEGCSNLEAHLANLAAHGVPVVVAINTFPGDTDAEHALIRERALAAGARAVAKSEVFTKGSDGGLEVADAVIAAAESGEARFRHAYEVTDRVPTKVEALVRGIYGGERAAFSPQASEQLARLESRGQADLPICVAKTQYSLSHDPALLGRPTGFEFPVRELRHYAGAGILVPLAGEVMTMPGLGRRPAFKGIDLAPDGTIIGLT
ncbi:Formate--tetrahydrofolate ligase [Planctomycetes bacterium Pla163]|uniref:Formate--tetrahydrofolate ligase n=1 Tax=Rohdeia mirabilis TaxID=2528008 RepID=A0A518CXD6_9BACT|nr:Formate--tetrahydrofolate ligase [Planctomycetes bacterium Pla163]